MSPSGNTAKTLCCPDSEKTCFFCCPPLRPHGYDPLQRRSVLEPLLRRNRERFLNGRQAPHVPSPEPINGWECWGLGYLDEEDTKVGCLLHPSQHNGIDYRYLIGYEGKCARETCLEAKTFDRLSDRAKRFYLDIAVEMDSFEYSSRERNPIFGVLLWGKAVGEKIAAWEEYRGIQRDEFLECYKVFFTILSYKTDGYSVEKIAEKMDEPFLKESGLIQDYKRWQEKLVQEYQCNDISPGNPSNRPVHLHDVPLSFSRFLKFGLNIWSAPEARVVSLKKQIDGEIERFIASLRRTHC